jgi:undecaprenyl-diphosphatase
MLLGLAVHAGPPGAFDAAFIGWSGAATPLAIVFTTSGLFPALAGIAVVALIVAWRIPAWRKRALFAVVLNVVAWKLSDVTKDLFHRGRPPQWVWHQETSFSYSSGHATDALVVYGLWAYFIARSTIPQPARALATWALALWALGVSWSRLALGVHYATDVIGGWLLGGALLALAFALYDPEA